MKPPHFANVASDGTKRIWYVERLWQLAAVLPVKEIEIVCIPAFDEARWYGYQKPTCRSVAEHAKRIDAALLEYPVILSAAGSVMDGMHRICKAWKLGMTTISAVQFLQDPEPDECITEPSTAAP